MTEAQRRILIGAALISLLSSCQRRYSTDEIDVVRGNANLGLARADAAISRIEELEDRVHELEVKVADLEGSQ